MAEVSVVVPTRDAASSLGPCLESIQRQTAAPTELIVVDGGSTDDTVRIAESCGATVVKMGPNRSAQRNRGGEIARGEFLLFIDADMVLSSHVIEECIGASQTF